MRAAGASSGRWKSLLKGGLRGWRTGVPAVAAAAMSGCVAPRGPLEVGSPDPAINVPAMVAAAQHQRSAESARLVEQLESDDPAVRLFAIQSLSRLHGGETLGYRHFDPPAVRRAAVVRWRERLALASSSSGLSGGAVTGGAPRAAETQSTAAGDGPRPGGERP